jgi:hypothetical protein
VRSSQPYNAYSGVFDADGTSQYVPGTSRNQGNRGLNLSLIGVPASQIQSSKYNDFDLRVSKTVFTREQKSLEVIGQAFNLFGHLNLLAANQVTNATSKTFGEITNASNAQEGELAAIFRF